MATAKTFKSGDPVRVSAQSGLGWENRTDITFIKYYNNNSAYINVPGYGQYNLPYQQLEPLYLTKEQLEAQMEKKKEELELIKAKLAYMKEFKTDTFDEQEFTIFRALEIIEAKGTRREKAVAVSKLLK